MESFHVAGLDHAVRQFRRAPGVARKFIGEAVRGTEILLAEKVRSAVPVRTGALKLAIGSKTVGLNASIYIEPGELFGERPDIYWRFVEFGTVNAPAQPFIRPPAEAEEQPFIGRVAKAGVLMERELTI